MKRLAAFGVLALFAWPLVVFAEGLVVNDAGLFQWNHDQVSAVEVDEYRFYCSRNSGVSIDPADLSRVFAPPSPLPASDPTGSIAFETPIGGFQPGQWYCVLTAWDAESGIEVGPTNEAPFKLLSAPTGFQVKRAAIIPDPPSSCSCTSAPVITGTSGTIDHDSSVTISGCCFGTKSTAKPLLWADFESDLNPSSLGVLTAWTDNEKMGRNTSAPQHNSLSSANSSFTWDTGAGDSSGSFVVTRNFASQTVYVYLKRRYSGSIPFSGSGTKFYRLWRDDDGCDFVASTSNGGIQLNECPGGDSDVFQSVSMPANTWMIQEFSYETGSGSSADGFYEYLKDGATEQVDTTVENPLGASFYGDLRVADNFTAETLSGVTVYQDDIYIEEGGYWHVMIGDASTLASSSTYREIQIPSAWSATSITVTVNQGVIPDSTGVYLYVCDSTNTCNSSGFSITMN